MSLLFSAISIIHTLQGEFTQNYRAGEFNIHKLEPTSRRVWLFCTDCDKIVFETTVKQPRMSYTELILVLFIL